MSYEWQFVADFETANEALREIEASISQGYEFAPTLLNSWVDYGTPYKDASFYKTGIGLVYLQGVIKSGSVDSSAFTLPIQHRPAQDLVFPVMSNSVFGFVVVQADGNVIPTSPCSNVSVSLNGIVFRSEQ